MWSLIGPSAANAFGVDHMQSQHDAPNQTLRYANLCYCCNHCNSRKGSASLPQSLIDDPLSEHLQVEPTGQVTALTRDGEWLRDLLLLNASAWIERRSVILEHHARADEAVRVGGDSMSSRLFEFPADLDDLGTLRPPANDRPAGIDESAHALRLRGELPRFC